MVFKRQGLVYVCTLDGTFEENTFLSTLCGFVELNTEEESFRIVIKNIKISLRIYCLSKVNQEWTLNRFEVSS